jgi:uncharacterized repeat protein (TIGR03803 family)
MKTCPNKWFALTFVVAVLGSTSTGLLPAQTFTILYSFSDGSRPSGLILSNNTLFGTATAGGSSGNGTVFSLSTNGSAFATLHVFSGEGDGSGPGGLILSGNTLYGTTSQGGTNGSNGTVFSIHSDGTGFTTLYSFSGGNDGRSPEGSLVLSGNTLYGTALVGGRFALGTAWGGTVFAINTDGTGFRILHSFTLVGFDPSLVYTNEDGAWPYGTLILSGNTLYGTTRRGGSGGNGTVFALNTDGTGFRVLHSFSEACESCANGDGANPYAGLALSGNTLYGTAVGGGDSVSGTVFKVNTDGTSFTTLYSFTALNGWPPSLADPTNSDGGFPIAAPILLCNTLYGTATRGGGLGNGTVFALNTDGTDFTMLHDFTEKAAAFPQGLISSGNTLYGTAGNTVFSISLPAGPSPLTILTLNTGVDDSRTPLIDYGVDPHFTLIRSADPRFPGPDAVVVDETLFPIATGDWIASSATSKWIAPQGNQDHLIDPINGDALGNYTYRTTFDLTGYDPGMVRLVGQWTVDSAGFDVLINGASTGTSISTNTPVAPEWWHPFVINTGLVRGMNTLDFVVQRVPWGSSSNLPTGLRAEVSLVITLPQLAISAVAGNVILTWPTNFTGFTLQSTTNLASSAAWTAISQAPVVVDGQNTVTNPISGAQQFYRLGQ